MLYHVKPYVQRNKNDYRDAQGIMEASFWAGMPYVTPKTVEQQDIQSLLRIRSNYIEIRTTVSNQLRGLMKEYGVFWPLAIKNYNKSFLVFLIATLKMA